MISMLRQEAEQAEANVQTYKGYTKANPLTAPPELPGLLQICSQWALCCLLTESSLWKWSKQVAEEQESCYSLCLIHEGLWRRNKISTWITQGCFRCWRKHWHVCYEVGVLEQHGKQWKATRLCYFWPFLGELLEGWRRGMATQNTPSNHFKYCTVWVFHSCLESL